MRWFIELSYDGGAYHGWQIQPGTSTVQGVLNEALSRILRTPIETLGAGRTDTGVNAEQMYAHFDTHVAIDSDQLAFRLNRLLPADIAIKRILRVADDAHARFDATSRTYHYFVCHAKAPFRRHYAYRVPFALDYALMNQAARILLQVDDFTSFSKLHTQTATNRCRVVQAEWVEAEPDLWCFEICADRFLRNMVRAIVGTLIDVGRGRLSLEEFSNVIAQKDRCAAADSVPPHALFLYSITYPYL